MAGRNPKLNGEKARTGAQGLIVEAMDMATVAGIAPPKTLGRWGREEWKRMIATLVPKGHLALCDLGSLEMLCRYYENWKLAELEVIAAEKEQAGSGEYARTPNGHLQQSAMRINANQHAKLYRTFAAQFGGSPVARIRTNGTAQGDLFDWPGRRSDQAEDEGRGYHDPTDPFGGVTLQ